MAKLTMRDKAFWQNLTKPERAELMAMQMRPSGGSSPYLPDDCSECGWCGAPVYGSSGQCRDCFARYDALMTKAQGRPRARRGDEPPKRSA